mmetsp:Transcript_4508/g.5849  ORF Transcript_4508/g.5849 Transcript_4508/m.5849 type:complete len:82 (-) Transcript_4508:77-322(-)
MDKCYMPSCTFKRYWQGYLWKDFFRSLLNLEDAESPLPVLMELRSKFEHFLYGHQQNFETLQMWLARESQFDEVSAYRHKK